MRRHWPEPNQRSDAMVQQRVSVHDWQPQTALSFIPNGPGVAGGIGPGGADGNVGRDTLIGPGLKDMDAGLLRNVNFERGMVFQFRAEVTNVMNWVSLSNPSSGNITCGLSGHHHLSRRHPARHSAGRPVDLLMIPRTGRCFSAKERPARGAKSGLVLEIFCLPAIHKKL